LYPDNKSLNLYHNLVHKYKPHGNKAYDYKIVSVMLANNIKKIITININDFKNIEEIEVIGNKK
jgi:predicted nucleic acid-binding protein